MQDNRTRSATLCRAGLALLIPVLACADQDAAPYGPPDSEGSSTISTEVTGESDSISGPPGIDTSEGTGESGESSGTTGDEACNVDDDCLEPTAPICVDGVCLGCDDAEVPDNACAAIDPMRAACGTAGDCVQCTAADSMACSAEAPVCNPTTEACEGCTAHEQCPDTACDIETGACFSDDCVLYVNGFGGHPDVSSALQSVAPGDSCVIIVEALDDEAVLEYVEPETLDVTLGRRIALRGDYRTTPPRLRTNDDVLVNVASDGTLYVSDLRLGPSWEDAVVVHDGTLYLDRAQIVTSGVAVRSTNAAARLWLRNSTLFGDYPPDGTLAVAGGVVEASFVSILANELALTCSATATVEIRNSLVLAFFGDLPDVDCDAAEISYSGLTEPYGGNGNQWLGPPQAEWFLAPWDDFHLSDAHPVLLEVTARWTDGDPLVDLDRDPRPGRDGAMTFAGADAPAIATDSSLAFGFGVEP